MYIFLIDFFLSNILNINISLLLYKIIKINTKEFILTLFTIYLLTNNITSIILLILIYLLNKIVFKILNYKLINIIIMYIINYLIIFKYNNSLIINLILVIILVLKEYKILGDNYKRISI